MQPSSVRDRYCLSFKSSKGISLAESPLGIAVKKISYNSLNARNKKNTTNELRTRTNFQQFLNEAPRSPFKKLICSTPLLLQGLRTMSIAKSVPDGLKPQECKRTKLRESPPIPYIPEKDEVQEEVARLRNLQIKTSLEKDTTLNFTVWHVSMYVDTLSTLGPHSSPNPSITMCS